MKMMLGRLLKWGKANSRKLFIVDGLGAITSAFLLGIVLVKLQPIFGIPKSSLYLLATIPCFFALYDFFCYLKNVRLGFFLKGIAIVNLMYCCLSLIIVTCHYEVITAFGWTYILLEILIVFTLAIYELSIAKTSQTTQL